MEQSGLETCRTRLFAWFGLDAFALGWQFGVVGCSPAGRAKGELEQSAQTVVGVIFRAREFGFVTERVVLHCDASFVLMKLNVEKSFYWVELLFSRHLGNCFDI